MATKDWKQTRKDIDMIIWKKGNHVFEIVSHSSGKKDVFIDDKIVIGDIPKSTALRMAKTYMESH